MKIKIIGYGYVGKAMEKFFCRHEISIYDPDKHLLDKSPCDVSVICVPTPCDTEGKCDISAVRDSVSLCEAKLTIIKSTVEPGTTDKLRQETGKAIVFSPEYCGESSYWSPYAWDKDIKEMPFYIFGGEKEDTAKAVDLYMPIGGPTKKYVQTTASQAEMCKYVTNAFAAMKIAFAYEIASVCKAADLDYHAVRELWLLDPRVNPMHTAVFPDNEFPFSGKCLPKDLLSLVTLAKNIGYDAELLAEVLRSNARIGAMRSNAKN